METKSRQESGHTEVVIDARGHRCPVPTLKLRRQLESSTADACVILWADDPMAQVDVPHFCNQNNYLLLSSDRVDAHWVFRVCCQPC